jgi:hypothetical protein
LFCFVTFVLGTSPDEPFLRLLPENAKNYLALFSHSTISLSAAESVACPDRHQRGEVGGARVQDDVAVGQAVLP